MGTASYPLQASRVTFRVADARRSAAAGAVIILLGMVLALLPVGGREASVQVTGWVLFAAALVEGAVGLTSSRPSVRRIELLMSCVTLVAVLLILFHAEAYPLTLIAATCLAIRGVGASVAAFGPEGLIRRWVLARGMIDLALASILMVGAPMAAIISVISGVPWPARGAAVLTNFVAVSVVATGVSLLVPSLWNRMPGRA